MVLQNLPAKVERNKNDSHVQFPEIDPVSFISSIQNISNGDAEQTLTLNGEDGSTFQTVSVPLNNQHIGPSFKDFVHAGPEVENVVINQLYFFVSSDGNSLHASSGSGNSFVCDLSSLQKTDVNNVQNCQVTAEKIECYHDHDEKSETVEINVSASEGAEDTTLIIGTEFLTRSHAISPSENDVSIRNKTESSTGMSQLCSTETCAEDFGTTTGNLSYEDRILKRNALLPKKASRRRLKVITCDKCQAVFKTHLQYYSHINIHMQKDENPVFRGPTCGQCGEEPKDSCAIKNHELKNHREEPCPHCNHSFKTNILLDGHIRNMHKGVKTFKCKLCNYKCFRFNDLMRHLNIHFGIKCHICDICGHQFTHPSNLRRHLRRHLNVKPYVCGICKRRFSALPSLIAHEFSHNGGNCLECGAYFKAVGSMRNHYKTYHKKDVHIKDIKNIFQKNVRPTANKGLGTGGMRYFRCQVCGERFQFKKALQMHEKLSHSNKILACKNCSKVFYTIRDLKLHSCDTRKSRLPESRTCLRSAHLKNTKATQPRKVNNCLRCSRYFETLKEMKTHSCRELSIKESDTGSANKKCLRCNRHFETMKEMESHLCIHSSIKEADTVSANKKCLRCNRHFETMKEMETHLYIHSSTKEAGTPTDSADEQPKITVSTIKSELQSGMIIYIISSEKDAHSTLNEDSKENSDGEEIISIIKPVAANNSIKLRRVKDQNKTRHKRLSKSKSVKVVPQSDCFDGSDQLTCNICSKTFTKKWNWRQHIATHDASLRRYKCEVCAASFSYRSTYTNHIRIHGEKTSSEKFECMHCLKTYNCKSYLNQHIKRVHKKEIRFQCSLCTKGFFKKNEFDCHMRVHRKELPYICFSCGKGFRHVSNLRRHERMHSGDRPHKCPHCPKSFIQPVTLRVHLRKHEALNNIPQKFETVEENNPVATGAGPLQQEAGLNNLEDIGPLESHINHMMRLDPI